MNYSDGRTDRLPRAIRAAGSAQDTLSIAVLIESSRAFGCGVLHGLAECIRQRRHWIVYYQEGGLGEMLPEWFASWRGDGVIARVENSAMAEALVRKGIPVVDLRGVCPMAGVPVVKTDNVEIARLAASHLLERGFRRFAYCGYAGADHSEIRRDAFVSAVGEAGYACQLYELPEEAEAAGVRAQEERGWADEVEMMEWLAALPKPIGVMACNDARGHQLLNAARRLGLEAPDELAVIGVDNHETICELSTPPLSSVEQNTARIASEAARLLEQMMHGEPAPAEPVLVKPCKVVSRRSTDILAIPDRNLRQAVRCLREKATCGIDVAEAARTAGLSRRELERRFVAAFGHPPGREIASAQIQTVKSLLVETDWPLYRIAEKAGYSHPEYLNVAFKRRTGMTPLSYRRQMAPIGGGVRHSSDYLRADSSI